MASRKSRIKWPGLIAALLLASLVWFGCGGPKALNDYLAVRSFFNELDVEPRIQGENWPEVAQATHRVRSRNLVPRVLPGLVKQCRSSGFNGQYAVLTMDRLGSAALPALPELERLAEAPDISKGRRTDVKNLVKKLKEMSQ